MTLLVGQNGTGWTIASGTLFSSAGNSTYFFAGYTAVASGTAALAHVNIQSTGSGVAEVYLYSGTVGTSTTFIAKSAQFPITATGDILSSISASITSGQVYTLVVQCGTNTFHGAVNSGSNNFKNNQNTSAQITFDSPPGSLPAANSTTGMEFIVWLDDGLSAIARNGAGMLMGMGS